MTSLPDADLLRRYAASCDEEAFRKLVERFGGMVLAAAARQVENPVLAEEVMQTVFTQVARKAAALAGHGSLVAWLHRATRLESLKARRTEQRRRERETNAFYMNVPDPVAGPDWEALCPLLDEALDDLRGPEREALLLRYFQGNSYREVGHALDIHEDAAKMRVTRALEKLRARLAKRGIRSTTAALAVVLSGQAHAAPMTEILARAVTTHAVSAAAAPLAFSQAFLLMIHTKALTSGVVLGLAVGGSWLAQATQSGLARASVSNTPGKPGPAPSGWREKPTGRPGPSVFNRRSPGEVLAALRFILTEPANEGNRLDLRLLLGELTPGEFGPLTDLIESAMTEGERARVLPELAAVWAAVDPAAAMARVISCRSAYHKVSGSILAKSVFTAWNTGSPAEAQRWLVERQDDPIFKFTVSEHISTVAVGLLEISDDSLLTWSAKLEGPDYRSAALQPLLTRFTGQEITADCSADLRRLYQLFERHPDPSFAKDALRALAKTWNRSRQKEWTGMLDTLPPGRLAWEAALAALSQREQLRVENGREIRFLRWEAAGDFTRRMNTVLGLAKGLTTSAAVSRIVAECARSSFAMREWALPMLEGPDKGTAIIAAVKQALKPPDGVMGDESPPRMALEWAAAHPDPSVRDPMIYGIYQNWLKNPTQSIEDPRNFPGRREWPEPLRAILDKAEAEM